MSFGRRDIPLPEPLTAGETAIRAADLRFSIGDHTILRDVSLDIVAGELLALVGPNGAGKSTLLNVIAGDEKLDSGTITVAGRELSDWDVGDLARRRSVLLQSNTLSFPFRVGEVVHMGRAPWRNTPWEADDDEQVTAALTQTETTAFTERTYPSLSGGERARVSFARVLAQSTSLLLLDEPTAALDIKHQETVLQIARDHADAGDAVVVVLHDLNLAAAYSDRIALMDNGTIESIGTPMDVLTAERISAVYHYPVTVSAHGTEVTIMPVRRPGRTVRPWLAGASGIEAK